MIVALWRENSTVRVNSFFGVSRIATVMVLAAIAGTLIFGIWLAISKEPYDIWDAWMIAAIVLWAIAGWTGQQSGKALRQRRDGGEAGSPRPGRRRALLIGETFGPSRAFKMHLVSNVAIVVILILT